MTEPSELCQKAAQAALTNEREYLEICAQGCQKCGQSKRLPTSRPKRVTYVA